MKPRWFLVQLNHLEIEILYIDSLRTWDYHGTFLSRYPADKYLCDDAVVGGPSDTIINWMSTIFLYMVFT